MSIEQFKIGLQELYQGEVTGEVVFCRLLERFRSPSQQYKLTSLLQLETEAKARLRPAIVACGLDPIELEESREKGVEFADSFEGMEWLAVMEHLATVLEPYVNRYREIAQLAPSEYKDLADSMVVHEETAQDFARLEAAGKTRESLDAIVKQLIFPLGAPT